MKTFRTHYVNIVLLVLVLSLGACAPESTAPISPDVASYGPSIAGLDISDHYDVTIPAQSYVVPGDVIAIGLGATVQGLKCVGSGACGSVIYGNGASYLFGWPIGHSNYGFVAMSRSGQVIRTMVNGNQVNAESMSGLIRSLEAEGWKPLLPADLPTPLMLALTNATAWLRGLATAVSSPAIFFIPSGGFIAPAPVLPPL